MSKKTNSNAGAEQTVVTLLALLPVKYQGVRICNKAFDCDPDTANELIQAGTCKLHVPEPKSEQDQNPVPTRAESIAAAIKTLKPAQFDEDGKPSLKALSKITESVVTEEERDAAWAVIESSKKGA